MPLSPEVLKTMINCLKPIGARLILEGRWNLSVKIGEVCQALTEELEEETLNSATDPFPTDAATSPGKQPGQSPSEHALSWLPLEGYQPCVPCEGQGWVKP